jgi:CBS domain-containing protein/sporulation protein YlmC with PRC-barrel domain
VKRPPATAINTVAKRLVRRNDLLISRKSVRDSLVSLAGLIGRPVFAPDGREIGRLVDVVVRHGEETYPPVSGLIVKVGNSKSFINGARISQLTPSSITLSSTKINLEPFARRAGESLLDADVLDHQIVDVDGLRVVRTSDLYLAPFNKEIRVIGVDISFVSFLRRLFPGSLSRRPTPDHVIDWASVASLTDSTGVVRTSGTRSALAQLRPADLADLIEDLAGHEQSALIEMLDPDLAADALEEMEDDELEGFLRGLSAERSAELLSRMEPDESAEVLRDLDEEHRESILDAMETGTAKQLRQLVSFDEELAGGIMTTHILIVKSTDSVADALKLLVENRERESSDGVVVVDGQGNLLDHIQTVELIAVAPESLVSELIAKPYPTAVTIETPINEVVEEFSNNRGSSIIVIDGSNKPIGRILADDLVDALSNHKSRFSQSGVLRS